jgi:YggT family protein
MDRILQIVSIIFTMLTWLVIVNVVLSYFMPPHHPLKMTLDRIVEPMLAPIRRIMPRTGMIDFSPIVLIILLQIIEFVLTQVLARI